MLLALAFAPIAYAEDWKLTGSGLRASTVFGSSTYVEVGTVTAHKHLYKIACGTINKAKTCRFVDQLTTDNHGTYTTAAVLCTNENFTVSTKSSDGFCDDMTLDFTAR